MSEQNGKVCANCRHNIRFAYRGDATDIRCYCHITHKPIDYVQGMTGWCRHWSRDVNEMLDLFYANKHLAEKIKEKKKEKK